MVILAVIWMVNPWFTFLNKSPIDFPVKYVDHLSISGILYTLKPKDIAYQNSRNHARTMVVTLVSIKIASGWWCYIFSHTVGVLSVGGGQRLLGRELLHCELLCRELLHCELLLVELELILLHRVHSHAHRHWVHSHHRIHWHHQGIHHRHRIYSHSHWIHHHRIHVGGGWIVGEWVVGIWVVGGDEVGGILCRYLGILLLLVINGLSCTKSPFWLHGDCCLVWVIGQLILNNFQANPWVH